MRAVTLLLKITKQFLGGVRRSREVVRFNYELCINGGASPYVLMFFCQKIKKMQGLPQGITRTMQDQNQEKTGRGKNASFRTPH